MQADLFDNEYMFREDVEPIIDELVQKCQEHGISLALYAIYAIAKHDDDRVRVSAKAVVQGKADRIPPHMDAMASLMAGSSPMHQMAVDMLLAAQPQEWSGNE